MTLMIAAGGLVLAGVTWSVARDYVQLQRSVRRRLEAAAAREALSLVVFLLLTVGPFIGLAWLLWPMR
jgi:hypothetical protein